MTRENDAIQISLSHSEALVLFEWLASRDERKDPSPDSAEQNVLWKIEGQLESILVDVVAADYRARVADAKKQVVSGVEIAPAQVSTQDVRSST